MYKYIKITKFTAEFYFFYYLIIFYSKDAFTMSVEPPSIPLRVRSNPRIDGFNPKKRKIQHVCTDTSSFENKSNEFAKVSPAVSTFCSASKVGINSKTFCLENVNEFVDIPTLVYGEKILPYEPFVLDEETQEWFVQQLQHASYFSWMIDVDGCSVESGWYEFCKAHLPICTVPLFLPKEGVATLGKAIFQRSCQTPRSRTQVTSSLNLSLAKKRSPAIQNKLFNILQHLVTKHCTPTILFFSWGRQPDLDEDILTCFYLASICDESSIFMLRLCNALQRTHFLSLFILSLICKNWRLLWFQDSQGNLQEIFCARSIDTDCAKCIQGVLLEAKKQKKNSNFIIKRILTFYPKYVSRFFYWRKQWALSHLVFSGRLSSGNYASHSLKINAVTPLRNQSNFYTVQQWLTTPCKLLSKFTWNDYIVRLCSQDKTLYVLWSDAQYTWITQFTLTKATTSSPPEEPVNWPWCVTLEKMNLKCKSRIEKTKVLPPHVLLVLSNISSDHTLFLFPKGRNNWIGSLTKKEQTDFIERTILKSHAFRKLFQEYVQEKNISRVLF